MVKILVTGGAGFVGSHLCERLISLNHDVISLDNYFTGSKNNHIGGVTYFTGNTSEIQSFFYNKTFDYIYHLGEYSRVEQSFEDIKTVFEYNSRGTQAVLEFVRKTGSKLIYAGSSTKFADKTDNYIMSPYAWTKATNTDLVKKYGEWFGINYAITYFYNVYGIREIKEGKYATLIAKYKTMMKNGETLLSVVKPGTQTRNFTHIDDIVDALILIGEYGQGDEYGIGNPTSHTIEEVVKMFGGTPYYLDERPGNRLSSPVITTKTRNLGWSAQHHLPEYIETLKQNGWNE